MFWLFSTLCPVTLIAQTSLQRMVVSELDIQVPSVSLDYPDQAIITIESTMENLRFDSNMNGIVAQTRPAPGEYVLFVDPQNQILTIDAPGFIQQRYPLRGLSARSVVNLQVEPQQQSNDLISVIFNVEPENAQLFVDGEQIEVNKTVRLSDGDVTLRLENEGYRTIEEDITINTENIQFTYWMEEVEDVPVLFYTNTEGAAISIDGVERGQTDQEGNLGIFLFPGRYLVEIRRSGYLTVAEELTVTEESDNRFDFELQRNIARLLLILEPPDATVSINRQVYGSQTEFDLAPGRYRLHVEKDGHEPFAETFELSLNEELQKQVRLDAHTGRLRIEVSPLSAHVELRNREGETVRRWQGLQVIHDLLVGEYQLYVEMEGYNGYSETINISHNETLEKSLVLQQIEESVHIASDSETGRAWMNQMVNALMPDGIISRDLIFEGENIVQTQMGEMTIDLKQTINFDEDRLIAEVDAPMGQITIQVIDGQGTMFMGDNEMPMQVAQRDEMLNEYYRNPLYLAINGEELDIQYMGTVEMDGMTVEHLTVHGNQTFQLYLDPDTSLPAFITFRQLDPQAGQMITLRQVFEDWTESHGVMMPYSTTIYSGEEAVSVVALESHTVE